MSEGYDKSYFLAKAEQCFRLARSCSDEQVAFRLLELGHQFFDEALKRGADPALRPADRPIPR